MTTFDDTCMIPVAPDIKARLPDKPSALIRLAVADMQKLLAIPDNKYKLDMGTWHDLVHHRDGKTCCICFAGAVMANSLECEFEDEIDPFDFEDHDITQKLNALNLFRKGDIILGVFAFYGLNAVGTASDPLERMRIMTQAGLPPINPNEFYRDVPQPHGSIGHERFYADMEEIATMLEGYGH